jgi:hypothetical protein
LIVGLAIALAVAAYVTHVPIPFLSKNLPHNPEQDAAEARKNKDWDPNAVLYGKNPAPKAAAAASAAAVRAAPPAPPPAPQTPAEDVPAPVPAAPVVKEDAPAAPPPKRHSEPVVPTPAKPVAVAPVAVAPAPPPKAAAPVAAAPATHATPAPQAAHAPDAPVPAPAAVAKTHAASQPPSDDPLGDLVAKRAQQRPAPAASAAGADFSRYLVQAGAYYTMTDAEAQRARLSIQGVEARITEREQAGRTVYRVRLGPFENKEAAERAKARLDEGGTPATLVKMTR